MSRKGENIRQRKDGRWEGRYPVWNAEKGCNVLKSVYARTYTEAKEKLAAAKVKHQQETFLQRPAKPDDAIKDIPCDMIAVAWLDHVRDSRKYSTYIKYSQVYRKHLQNIFLRISSKDISMDKMAAELSALEIPSWSLTKSIYSVANQILEFAHECCGTPYHRISPKRERAKTEPVEILAQAEQVRLLKEIHRDLHSEPYYYKLGMLLCIHTGLRIGEICALKWADIDLDGGLLYVNRTVQRIQIEGQDTKTGLVEDEPKSVTSKREIPLSDDMLSLLSSMFAANPKNEYVVCGNRPAETRTMYNHYLKCLKLAGIGERHFHCLRHTFATNCVNAGVDIKSLSEILGHADVSITLNRYVHPTIETKRKHMNALSGIMGQYMGQKKQRIA